MSLIIGKKQINDLTILTSLLGFDQNSLLEYLNWCLLEHLVADLSNDKIWLDTVKASPRALFLFKTKVEERTGYIWDNENILKLYDRIKATTEKHFRQQVTYVELLRLLINAPMVCANPDCGKAPPLVKLHIDHIFPASKGGSSKFENLQFLCENCNLKKYNKIYKSDIWLKLESLQPL